MRKIAIVTAVGVAVTVGVAVKVATSVAGWHGLNGTAINDKRLCTDGMAYRWAGFESDTRPPANRPVGQPRWIGPFDILVQVGPIGTPEDEWLGKSMVGADIFVAVWNPVRSTDGIWHPHSHSGVIPFRNPVDPATQSVHIDTDPGEDSADNVILPVNPCHLFGRLDVVPHDPANPVDLSPGAHVVVALLSTPSFNATAVAPASARFGATGTEAAPTASAKLDVNGDGRKDLRLRFATGQTGIQCGQSSAEFSAQDPGSKKTFYEADTVSPPPC